MCCAYPAAAQYLDDSSIIAQASVFTLAGYDTTANTLSLAIYNVSSHPEVQEQLCKVRAWLRSQVPAGRARCGAILPTWLAG